LRAIRIDPPCRANRVAIVFDATHAVARDRRVLAGEPSAIATAAGGGRRANEPRKRCDGGLTLRVPPRRAAADQTPRVRAALGNPRPIT